MPAVTGQWGRRAGTGGQRAAGSAGEGNVWLGSLHSTARRGRDEAASVSVRGGD